MNIKEKIVALLENNRDEYLSGNDIAKSLEVSRNAVWKSVKKLEEEGYIIEAIKNKGYRLMNETDVISEAGMKKYLGDDEKLWRLSVYDEVGSTNDVIREKAGAGGAHGEIVAAVKQTSGKGRLGRSFFSPEKTGLYFSILLRSEMPLDKLTYVTTAAALAVCRAIENLSDYKPEIKWVNDVLLNHRKICGIGTEAVFNAELRSLDYIILGVGINVYSPKDGFPEEISGKAGYIFEKPQNDIRNRLMAEFLKQFRLLYENLGSKESVEEYRKRCCILNREILVCRGEERISAFALDVDDRCRLKVRYEDGSEEYLNSGEISIKFDNYI